jgi:N-acetylneuraminic acid mutarotase
MPASAPPQPLAIAQALVAAGYSAPAEIAVALRSVFPGASALDVALCLVGPAVFPNLTKGDLGAALLAAPFAQADVDQAVATLFPPAAPVLQGRLLGPATSLPIARQGGVAATFGANIVYLGGGGMGPAVNYPNAELCWSLAVGASGPSTAAWSPVAAIPAPVAPTVGAVVGTRAYLFGGFGMDDKGFGQTAQAFDSSTNSWTGLPGMPIALVVGGAAAVGDKIYLVGGSTYSGGGAGPSNAVLVYDTVAGAWSNGPALPQATFENSCAAIGDHIYCVGGTGGDFVLDTTTQTWAPMPGFPGGQGCYVSALTWNRFLIVLGGLPASGQGGWPSNAVWSFDTVAGQWTQIASLGQARGVAAATVAFQDDERALVYYIGGVPFEMNAQPFPTVEVVELTLVQPQ